MTYITGILGNVGSGKTLNAVRLVSTEHKLNPQKKILSNIHLTNLPYEPIDLAELYIKQRNLRDLIILLDEVYTFFDCRASSTSRNRIQSYFIAQTRKRGVDLFYTAQFEKFFDLRLSLFTNVRIVMKNKFVIVTKLIGNNIVKIVEPHPYIFYMTYYDTRFSELPSVTNRVLNGLRWFGEYDTYEEVYPPDEYIETQKLIKNYDRTKRKE